MEKAEVHILTEIAAGNIQAFEQLFFRYQPKLVCFLTGLTHDSELSRDMAQEMFLSIWKDREKLVQVEIRLIQALFSKPLRSRLPDHCRDKILLR